MWRWIKARFARQDEDCNGGADRPGDILSLIPIDAMGESVGDPYQYGFGPPMRMYLNRTEGRYEQR